MRILYMLWLTIRGEKRAYRIEIPVGSQVTGGYYG